MNTAAVRHLDDWLVTKLSIPTHWTKDGRAAYNTLITGRVGTGKTQLVKKTLERLVADNYAIVILDVEEEYREHPETKICLPESLVNADTLSAMLGTDAAYLDLVAEFLHVPGNLCDFVESRGIAGQQLTHFQRAVKKVQHLATMGEDLIDAINKDQVVRIRLDPDYAPQQMIILTRYLTESHDKIDGLYEGVMVILEENERLAAMDKTRQIPHAVFAGRKRGIYYVVVGHTPLEQLKAGEWGAALADQFDNIIAMEATL